MSHVGTTSKTLDGRNAVAQSVLVLLLVSLFSFFYQGCGGRALTKRTWMPPNKPEDKNKTNEKTRTEEKGAGGAGGAGRALTKRHLTSLKERTRQTKRQGKTRKGAGGAGWFNNPQNNICHQCPA